MRILLLALVLGGLAASQASAKTIDASSWRGKLIVFTNWKYQDERHKAGNDNEEHATADHMMSGRVRHLLLPHRTGVRSSWLGGGGSLDQLKGSVSSSYKDVDARRTISNTCAGKMRNNGGETLQFRTMMGHSEGVLKLVVDGMSLMPTETCTIDGYRSPTFLDGWPEDWVFALPGAPQRTGTLELQSDWWHFRSTCGEGEEREGSGAPPGVVTTKEDGVLCISGQVTRVHTLLTLRRVCAHVRVTTTRSSASEKCVRRR
jgi:hypothetical protein